jgi:hypothetical protein
MIILIGSSGNTFLNPLFSNHLIKQGVPQAYTAIIFTTSTITYIFSINLLPRLNQKIHKRVILSAGLILGALADFLIAGEPYLGLP